MDGPLSRSDEDIAYFSAYPPSYLSLLAEGSFVFGLI